MKATSSLIDCENEREVLTIFGVKFEIFTTRALV